MAVTFILAVSTGLALFFLGAGLGWHMGREEGAREVYARMDRYYYARGKDRHSRG